ncbi:hypothetical protein BBAL3_1110 [Brevundimonas sp. BAL3]|uniref:DUF6441 family protein n=1 Tax=Brevundimonas sp. BAL3 TaxID=391600 RepID=UPI00017ED50F|nr:DUF6441 family protein [Brevundimonas sp. BAL3]EDX79953.1 hypothetical protein BBAL3_1110 [Brevundimonas sp. BAL3]
MRHSVGGREALDGFERGLEEEIARFQTGAIRDGAEELKQDWRDQILDAGLGQRLANTIRSEVYPRAQVSLDAAALIWTKAPQIIESYASGATIRPVNGGRYLWVPTDEVPKTRRGQRLGPQEVEARFGRKLIVIDPKHWRMRTSSTGVKGGVAYAGFDGLVVRKASGRWKNATRNQMTPGSRSYRETTRQFVVMFTLLPMVKKEKRLDLDALAGAADRRHDGLLNKNWR